MVLLYLLETLVTVFVVWLVGTQIIFPIVMGLPMFPAFTSKRSSVLSDLEDEKDTLEAALLEQELEVLRSRTESLKHKPKESVDESDTK